MDKQEVLWALHRSVLDGDADAARQSAHWSIEAGISPMEAIAEGLTQGIRESGEQFASLQCYLPEMLLSVEAMQAALQVLEPYFTPSGPQQSARVLVGTVQGDIHDIGKNIVISLLSVNGFEVIDAGRDLAPAEIVDGALTADVQIVGLSCLMSASLPVMKEVIQIMGEEGVRDRFKVIIGGGSASRDWADRIGADGYGDNAHQAVLLCQQLLDEAGH